MKIIRLKLFGGLGNQLFQAAFAYSISKKYENSIIILDKTWFKNNSIRDYLLDELFIKNCFTYDLELDDKCRLLFLFHDVCINIKNVVNYISRKLSFSTVLEDNIYLFLSYFGILTDTNRKCINFKSTFFPVISISGYFQDINYFDQYRNDLLKLFSVSNPNISYSHSSSNNNHNKHLTSFMIRLGEDYFSSSINNVYQPSSFIKRSIYFFESLKIHYLPIFFSDEIDKLNNLIDVRNFSIVDHVDPLIQFEISKRSKYFVIANSSFAWWCYYLSDFDSKILIIPKIWFSDCPAYFPGFSKSDYLIKLD